VSNLANLSAEERTANARKARDKKRRISAAINIKSVTSSLKRMREPGEIPSIRTAIKWKCFDCMGWESDGCRSLSERVRQCECPHCPMYPWRGGVFNDDVIGETGGGFFDDRTMPWRKADCSLPE